MSYSLFIKMEILKVVIQLSGRFVYLDDFEGDQSVRINGSTVIQLLKSIKFYRICIVTILDIVINRCSDLNVGKKGTCFFFFF
jgi:hypothetical protein